MRDLLGLSVRGRFKNNPQDRRLRRAAFAREVYDVYRREGGLNPERCFLDMRHYKEHLWRSQRRLYASPRCGSVFRWA